MKEGFATPSVGYVYPRRMLAFNLCKSVSKSLVVMGRVMTTPKAVEHSDYEYVPWRYTEPHLFPAWSSPSCVTLGKLLNVSSFAKWR